MSLDQLSSQLDDLRAQATRIQGQWARTTNRLDTDPTLSDTGKRAQLDSERERINAQLSDLRKKETELITAKRQSLQKRLFGLSSSDPGQIITYRDAGDRAARLTQLDEAREVFSRATLSGDKTLAAAVLARALEAGWSSIVSEYIKQNPASGDDLDDLATLQQYGSNSFMNGISYALL